MKRYMYFDTAFDTISNINNSLYIEDNHISFSSKTKKTLVKAVVFENFFTRVYGAFYFNNLESGLSINSNKAAHFYIFDHISNHFLISATLSSPNYVPAINEIKKKEIYLSKSLGSFSAKYSNPSSLTSCLFQFGLRNDQSPMSVFSFSRGGFNFAVKGVLTDRANLVYTSILMHGIIASLKFDVSLSQLQGIECGYLYNKSNDNKKNNTLYALYNISKQNLEFGGFGLIGNKRIAASGRYEIKSKEFTTEFGGFIFDVGELRLKFNSKQQLEFLTKLSPKPWADVSFKTTSTISNAMIKSVTFGWSLDFHKDF